METKPTPAEFLEKKYNGTIPELWMRQGFTTAAHVMENMRDYSADLLAKVSEQEKEIENLKKLLVLKDGKTELQFLNSLAEVNNDLFKRNTKIDEELSEQSQRIQQLEEALRELEPFAKEVVSRQKNENVFGYNREMLKLSTMKKIVSLLSKFELPNTTLTKEQMRQQEDLSEQREEYD